MEAIPTAPRGDAQCRFTPQNVVPRFASRRLGGGLPALWGRCLLAVTGGQLTRQNSANQRIDQGKKRCRTTTFRYLGFPRHINVSRSLRSVISLTQCRQLIAVS
jgi:hypothetical protein